MKTYYHVSSFLKENQVLTHDTKNNYEFCKLICRTDISSSYNKYIELLRTLEEKNVEKETGRDVFKWSCESIFEMIRFKHYNSNPSRVWGIFVSESLEDAHLFNKNYRNGESKIFEIQPKSIVYKFDMDIFTEADKLLRENSSVSNYEKSIKLAHEYWKGILKKEQTNIEYLFDYGKDEEVVVGKSINFP